jgi:penicillin-binding protein 1A
MRRFLNVLTAIIVVLVLTPVASVGVVFASLLFLPLPAELPERAPLPPSQISRVYDAGGNEIASYKQFDTNIPVEPEDIPDVLKQAVVAAEDRSFYEHGGVDIRGTARALWNDLQEGSATQGGSTITQQLVKQELVGDAQNLERKAREAILASRLERTMTKDEILERYLNSVYFGYGAYGVQAAAETYFGVNVELIDPVQAALLAGLIANPSAFDPVRRPESAKLRRDFALRRMVDEGVIEDSERDLYVHVPLPDEVNQLLPPPDDYFAEEIKRILLDDPRLGETRDERRQVVFRGGLRVYTTLDLQAQDLAQSTRDAVLAEIDPDARPGTIPIEPNPLTDEERFATSAQISLDNETGAVLSMVGGPGFDLFQYNIATQAVRQTGSSYKTLVLLAALDAGHSPYSTVNGRGPCVFDRPGEDEPYDVQNFDNSFGSTTDIVAHTIRSSNCAYVRLGQIVGLESVIEMSRDLGITAPLDPSFWSLPLGSVEVRPIEMAGAYAAIANDGLYNEPYFIEEVHDRSGQVLFSHEPDPVRVMKPQTARVAAEILERNVQAGTGSRADIPGQRAAGKTGTAQNSGDAWFVGFTPYITTAVWMGSPDDNFDVRVFGSGVTGGSYPAEIWGRYMRAMHFGRPPADYVAPRPPREGVDLALGLDVDPRGGLDVPQTSPTTTVPGDESTVPPPPTSTTTTISPPAQRSVPTTTTTTTTLPPPSQRREVPTSPGTFAPSSDPLTGPAPTTAPPTTLP